jgi:large conductance mechanosensitive channel
LKYIITPKAGDIAESAIKYGQFLQNVIDFLIISISIFLVIKFINSFRRKKEEEPKVVAPTRNEILLTEIRDLLKERI